MRILVTGGTGFLGSAFVQHAIAAGHSVGCLARTANSPLPEGVTRLTGTVGNPPWTTIEAFRPEACVHSAWIATPGVYLESPENDDWAIWSQSLLEGLVERGVTRVVALGTCIEYRITGAPLSEDSTPLAPVSRYARAKHRLHESLRPSLEAQGVSLAWARVFYPYGELEHRDRFMSSLLRRLRAGETVVLRTPTSVKDYLHADDVASALGTVLDHAHDGSINIGTGAGVAVGDIARILADGIGRPELIRLPEHPVADPLDHVVADATRLRSLGWSPQVTLERGLDRMIQASLP